MSESLAADFTLKWTGAGMHRHVPGQIVMCVENFATNFAGEGLRSAITTFSANSSGGRADCRKGRRFGVL